MGALRNLAVALAAFAAVMSLNVAAGQEAESVIYGATKDCSGLRAYLKAYPNGRFRADAEARIAKECAPPAPRNLVTPSTAKPAAPADPCVRSRADWPQISGSTNLEVLRAFLRATPGECEVQRAQASVRISELETAIREAEAKAAAERNAEAQRQAAAAAAAKQAEDARLRAEREAAEQRQALLNRSWSAIAISDWSPGFLNDFVAWGGVTGQSSPEAAEAAAVKACQAKKDAVGCAVEIKAWNLGCASFAYVEPGLFEGGWGTGSGNDEATASANAVKNCELDGCKVKLAICATPG